MPRNFGFKTESKFLQTKGFLEKGNRHIQRIKSAHSRSPDYSEHSHWNMSNQTSVWT